MKLWDASLQHHGEKVDEQGRPPPQSQIGILTESDKPGKEECASVFMCVCVFECMCARESVCACVYEVYTCGMCVFARKVCACV